MRGGAFVGNDSSGAELAWGGWRQSQRLTLLGEVLPLPDVLTLRDGNAFGDQRDDGSKPFGVFWVLQAPRFAQHFGRVLVFDKGSLVEDGTPTELAGNESHYAKLVAGA